MDRCCARRCEVRRHLGQYRSATKTSLCERCSLRAADGLSVIAAIGRMPRGFRSTIIIVPCREHVAAGRGGIAVRHGGFRFRTVLKRGTTGCRAGNCATPSSRSYPALEYPSKRLPGPQDTPRREPPKLTTEQEPWTGSSDHVEARRRQNANGVTTSLTKHHKTNQQTHA